MFHVVKTPTINKDCLTVLLTLLWIAGVFMWRRKLDLCVPASSWTMLTFENNVSCSSSARSTLASNLRWHGRDYACVQVLRVNRKRGDCSNAPRNPWQVDLCACVFQLLRLCRNAGTQASTYVRMRRRRRMTVNSFMVVSTSVAWKCPL